MENSLRLVQFTPSSQEKELCLPTLQGYNLFTADTAEEAIQIVEDDGIPFDIAIIPIKLIGDNNGLDLCRVISNNPSFCKTINVVIDPKLSREAYLCGADFVIKADELQFQLQNIIKTKQKLSIQKHNSESPMLFDALNCSTNGVLLFDPAKGLIFANMYAANLLGLLYPTVADELCQVENQFKNILREHISLYKQQKIKRKNFTSSYQLIIERLDQYTFQAACTVCGVFDENNQIKYLGVALSNVSNIRYLSNKLIQAQQLNTIFLSTCAACVLPHALENKRLSLITCIKNIQAELPDKCEIYPCITLLIETMDLILSKDKSFKVNVEKNYLLPIKSSDFIQMMGLILLHITDHADKNGIIQINTSSYIPSEGIYITVLTESLDRAVPPSSDVVSRLLSGDLSDILSVEDAIEKTALGLAAAQNIADRYGITIEYQNSNSYIKARFKIPVITDNPTLEDD